MKTELTTIQRYFILFVVMVAFVLLGRPATADHPCSSPLILDLDGDGILAWGSTDGVDFDIDGDGVDETIGWTGIGEDAFLWTDRNHNREVDDGSELFGSAYVLPSGEIARDGFQALATLDALEAGGNEDGIVDPSDEGWGRLLLWVDSNRDGRSDPSEIRPLAREGVLALDLGYVALDQADGSGNYWAYEGTFVQRVRDRSVERFRSGRMVDIFFDLAP